MLPTEISKAYKIYSQFLYSEARNYYFASKFVENLKKEYSKTIDRTKLDTEISVLMEKVSHCTNKKEMLKTKVPNYKTLASFYIKLHDGDQYLSSRETLRLDETDALERAKTTAATKVQVGESARFVGQQSVQLHGGMGMTDELSVGHYFKRLTMIDTMFGDYNYHLKRYSNI